MNLKLIKNAIQLLKSIVNKNCFTISKDIFYVFLVDVFRYLQNRTFVMFDEILISLSLIEMLFNICLLILIVNSLKDN